MNVREELFYRLLAVDLDGSLLDSQHALPPRNREALHRAHERGIRIVLCTGRSFTETRPILEAIGLDLDATVTVTGALVTDLPTGRTWERTPLSLPLAHEVTGWFQQRGYTVLWLLDCDEVGFDGYAIAGPRRHAAVDRWLAQAPVNVRCIDRTPTDSPAPLRVTIVDETSVLETVADDLRAAFDTRVTHNVLRVPAYGFTVVEVFAPQVNKWYGIEKLCRRWQIDPARTVAVGDDVNDVEMIRRAGLGVAMANAQPALRAVARHFTISNDECGVAALIERLLVGENIDPTPLEPAVNEVLGPRAAGGSHPT